MRFARVVALLFVSAVGCAADDAAESGAGNIDSGKPMSGPRAARTARTRGLYALEAAPMRFGAVPYPDDAYRDGAGRVSVRDLPSSAPAAYRVALVDALAELDGFGARPVIYLRFDGPIDPASLPADAAASLQPEASVFLLDADTNSPWAYQRVPIDVRYVETARELRLTPAYGRPLAAGRRYAAVATTSVRAAGGGAVGPAAQLARVVDGSEMLDEPAERAARARYEPVLASLAQRGTARSAVAAIAVFTVQSAGRELADARALLHAAPLPALAFDRVVSGEGLDALLGAPREGTVGLDHGAPHDQLGLLAQARVELPSFLAASDRVHGGFTRDGEGALLVRGSSALPLTLFVPREVSPSAALPLLVVLHDDGGERSDASAIANALCGRGYVVAAADLPFHGLRAGGADGRARFTGAEQPDGFGDEPGDLAGFDDDRGPLPAGHPAYLRDALRQAAAETMGLLRVLTETDFRAFADLAPQLGALRLQTSRVALLGVGLGAEVAVLMAPLEPALDATVLAFAGGVGADGWLEASASRPLAEALLGRLGRAYDGVDWTGDPPATWPDVDAFRTIADRGSALTQAAALRHAPSNVLLLMAADDERAPNARTEALAAALGARLALEAGSVDPELGSDELSAGDTVRGNVSLEAGDLTRSLVRLDPATHDTLSLERGERAFEPRRGPPFTPRDEPEVVDNPTAAALMQVAYFFESLRGCEPAGQSPCSATALVP